MPNIDDRPQTINPDAFKNLDIPQEALKPDDPEKSKKGKPPKFIVHLPIEVKLHYGVKFQTRCKIEGYPLPKVYIIQNYNNFLIIIIFI